jgi:hypothetical protein
MLTSLSVDLKSGVPNPLLALANCKRQGVEVVPSAEKQRSATICLVRLILCRLQSLVLILRE